MFIIIADQVGVDYDSKVQPKYMRNEEKGVFKERTSILKVKVSVKKN